VFLLAYKEAEAETVVRAQVKQQQPVVW